MSSGLHGYLVIDKPAGWTSHDVVGRLRRLLGERKIGHAGTLDPAATGVLPIAVGHATKTLEFLAGSSKTYLAEVTFGIETDSFDGDGRVTNLRDLGGVEAGGVAMALSAMVGPQLQLPPMHSAVKIDGKRLYEAARRGEEIERPVRPVVFHALDLVDWTPPVATVHVDCSKGTYVRSLANDLGRAAGAGAYLSNLVRLRSGPFRLDEAWTMRELQEIADPDPDALWERWPTIAVHPDAALDELPALLLNEDGATRWTQGKAITEPALDVSQVDGTAFRTYDALGRCLGIGRFDQVTNTWRPAKVIVPATESAHAMMVTRDG